ncbi:LysR family transcriptional regulator [Aliiglaciecola sp. NS0011-25]|uniref:LysR family transcriptional regulator n=1 Tax=Aliiglaciecola sp. NS0011-25 TaxID=3127654 RepID=UPI0031073F4E
MAEIKQIQRLDLNLLKVFESLYLEQNMTRTADRLNITPSAVSHAVKRLRDCLQDPLFERSQNKMMPTPACKRMAPLIIDNLSRLRQILQQWGEFDPLTSEHHFRIAMHDALEPTILPSIAKILFEKAPNITFASVKVERNQLSKALTSGQFDLAFDIAMPLKPPIRHENVRNDKFMILMDRQHPLFTSTHIDGSKVNSAEVSRVELDGHGQDSLLKQRISQEQYFSAEHISVSHRPTGAVLEDFMFQEQGFTRQVSVRCQNYYAAKEILKGSPFFLTLPSSIGARLLDSSLVSVAVPFDMPLISTHMYWHQNTEDDLALRWFREAVHKIMIDNNQPLA